VFGTVTGERVLSFKRAWQTAVLKAHGHKPTYLAGANLSTESRAALRAIDLHFHDLRREAGSRWLDAGVPLHQIQAWLGHTNIAQTSTYLAVTDAGADDAMAKFDRVRAQELEGSRENLANNLQTRKEKWSGRLDSNQRPPAPKAGALPGCATPRL